MKTSTSTKALGLLALLGSSASMAATVVITASNLAPNVGENFTMTLTGNIENTFTGTMALAFDASKVSFVSGAALAPFTVFTKNSLPSANPTVFDMESPATQNQGGAFYNIAVLTFTALASGAAGIVINDDGGVFTGWFDADTFDVIPVDYTQANVVVTAIPAPAAVWLLGTGLAGLVMRSVRRKRAVA